MQKFKANYYDGHSSEKKAVVFSVDQQGWIFNSEFNFRVNIRDVDIRPRIGNSLRQIYLPNGGVLESPDNDFIDQLCIQWEKHNIESLVQRSENSRWIVMLSATGFLAILYLLVQFAIPAASQKIVSRLPLTLDRQIGDRAFHQIDSQFFKPSTLDSSRISEVEQLFEGLAPDSMLNYQIHVRHSAHIGANAFALPNGSVIVTDDLIKMAEEAPSLTGILLHEIAHIENRHAMQLMVRQAGLSAVVFLATGDATFASALVLMLPTLLIETGYSRELEKESDGYAIKHMLKNNNSLNAFAILMEKLLHHSARSDEKYNNGNVPKNNDASDEQTLTDKPDWTHWLSTHPDTEKRLQRIREAAALQRAKN